MHYFFAEEYCELLINLLSYCSSHLVLKKKYIECMSVRKRPEPTIIITFHVFKGERPGVFCMRMITLEKWTIR